VSLVNATGIQVGTVLARRQRLSNFEISEVVFAPDHRLSWHGHPQNCLAVVIRGDVRKTFSRFEEDAVDGTVVEMPAGERHEDLFGPDGARIVVVESDQEPGRPRCFRDWKATVLAHDISRELAQPDAYTALALEGLALELTATAARQRDIEHREPRLDAVRDTLTRDLTSPRLSLRSLARSACTIASRADVPRAIWGEHR
jgi:quercetin dioxygenase-like cupin family protein